jgi:tetraacyldisaccharide 4'-kinase
MASRGRCVNSHSEDYIRSVLSGSARGAGPALLRGATRLGEVFYSGAMRARNQMFDSGIRRVHRLPRSVISIGNITTGGTGKTPAVQWLANSLRNEGHCVAILSRGYRSAGKGLGDELTMLDRLLNHDAEVKVSVRANPDRHAAGLALLRDHPDVDVIILDDGFQHRRLARDFDLVLINAAQPFGFGHVLPRGLLREPLSGLRRANAIAITHSDHATADGLAAIEKEIRRHNIEAPIYRCEHAQVGLASSGDDCDGPMELLAARPFFAFCGIGDPDSFRAQLSRFGNRFRGLRPFADHHKFTGKDLNSVLNEARNAGAELLVTTEKDWVKIEPLLQGTPPLPIYRVRMELRFQADSESRLRQQLGEVLKDRRLVG